MPLPRVLSGIQPSGVPHLGNYLGAVKQWVEMQSERDCYFMIADLHTITLPYEPERLRADRIALVASLLACGIHPERSVLFLQSSVREHTGLTWLLSSATQMGELSRMVQFKEKTQDTQHAASAALFSYPILQAADILLYDATEVPVGDDQRQHIELCRDVAQRFNSRFGEVFVIPKAVTPIAGGRVMDLQHPTRKMSKSSESDQGLLSLVDSDDELAQKIRRAVTDSEGAIYISDAKPGLTNLLYLMAGLRDAEVDVIEAEYRAATYSKFKEDLVECVVASVAPIRARIREYLDDAPALSSVLRAGQVKASGVAGATFDRAMRAMGFGE